MSLTAFTAAASWWAGDAAGIPSRDAMQWGLQASWSVVLAWLGAALAVRWTRVRAVPVGVAVALAASTWLPGQASASYWLGLAFQAPSITAVLLCALLLRTLWTPSGAAPATVPARAAQAVAEGGAPDGVWAGLGVLLGWVLLLDAFAVLPVPLYAWGFSPAAAVLALLLGLLPWLLAGSARSVGRGTAVWALAVWLFVLLRLPSGNLWDAVLDPWLWLVLHLQVGRRVHLCYKNRSYLTACNKG